MTDAHESSPEEKKRLHANRRRASQAMVNHIVLRDTGEQNLDPDSHEGWLRSQVFRLEHEALQLDPDGEFDTDSLPSLGETMMNPHLNDLAQPGRPITPGRLVSINPAYLNVMASLEYDGIGWPSDDNSFHDALPVDLNDKVFGEKLIDGGRAYNNFPAILTAAPRVPVKGEDFATFASRTSKYQYASKPYLIRAHALQPEFMGALQHRMAEINSLNDWQESLYRAVSEDHPDPEDQILLRASRLAYQLLINLMRKDDIKIQSQLLSMSDDREITDPRIELWT